MNPLLKRLAMLRRKVRFLDGWLGTCALIALALGVGLSVGIVDFYLHLPSLARAAFLVGLLVGGSVIVYRYLIRPFTNPCDDLNLALRIEAIYPNLNDSLATTVQFLQQPKEEQERLGGSEAMREKTIADAIQKADQVDFGKILDRRGALIFGVLACCVLLLSGTMAWSKPMYSNIAFWRFVEPFGQHTWTTITVAKLAPVDPLAQLDETDKWKKIDLKEKDRVAIGRPYKIKVNLVGQMPRKGEAHVEIVGQTKSDRPVKLKPSEDSKSATFEFTIESTQQPQKFKFRILANDGAFPPRSGTWHEVDVVPPPKLVKMDNGKDSPQITIVPPAYSDLPTLRLEPGDRHLKLYAGSNVVLRAKADRALKEAWIEYRPENDKLIPVAALAFFAQTETLPYIAAVGGSHAVWGRTPAKVETNGNLSVTFMPWVSGDYILHLRDFDDLDHRVEGNLNVLLDPIPEVKLVSPRATVTVLPDGDVSFKFAVTDQEFALKSVYLEHRKKAPDGQWLEDAKQNILYQSDAYGSLLPNLSVRMGMAPIPGAHPLMGKFPLKVPDLRLRPKKLEFDMVWSLRNQFAEGDLIVVEVCADDYCNLYPSRGPGRSHAIELRVISMFELKRDVETRSADIMQKIKKIIKLEEQARDTANVTKKQDKIDQKVVENFTDNGQGPQREVKDRTGNTSEEGVRRDVKELRKMLKDNRLTNTEAYRQLTKIAGTLESISQQELPQIDPKLTDAYIELSKLDKNDAVKTRKNLDEAVRLQESVLKALNELIKVIDPQAKMQDITNKQRAIIQEQKDLALKLEGVKERKEANDNNKELSPENKKTADEKFKADLAKIQQEQNALADKLQQFVEEMKDAKADFEKLGDPRNAKKLDAAIKNAEPPLEEKAKPPMPPKAKEIDDKKPINAQMKDVAKELKKNPNDVKNEPIQKQKDIVKKLEKGLDALEGNTLDATKDEIKDRKDTEKKLDDIARELKKLRDDTKKFQDQKEPKDKEERLKKEEQKKELIERHAKLQEKIEETRRELARLNEQKPANELKQAADKLEEAKAQIEQGGNAGPAQKDAAKDVNQAKEDVKQAQEELARELLVKMADQLEGLKIREVALVERSEKFHEKVMKLKLWTEPFLETIDGNIDAQKGVADETENLKEKIKEAKVFHSILGKAKDAMDRAGEAMAERRAEGAMRQNLDRMDEAKLNDEADAHDETIKQQKYAVKRLENLLDSIKEEIAKMDKKKEEREPKPPEPMDPDKEPKEKEKEQGGMKPQDGIPPMAQLKALRAEQLDLNERTKDFDKRFPDRDKLRTISKITDKEITVKDDKAYPLAEDCKFFKTVQRKGKEETKIAIKAEDLKENRAVRMVTNNDGKVTELTLTNAAEEIAELSREQTSIRELFQQILPKRAEPKEQKEEKKGEAK